MMVVLQFFPKYLPLLWKSVCVAKTVEGIGVWKIFLKNSKTWNKNFVTCPFLKQYFCNASIFFQILHTESKFDSKLLNRVRSWLYFNCNSSDFLSRRAFLSIERLLTCCWPNVCETNLLLTRWTFVPHSLTRASSLLSKLLLQQQFLRDIYHLSPYKINPSTAWFVTKGKLLFMSSCLR